MKKIICSMGLCGVFLLSGCEEKNPLNGGLNTTMKPLKKRLNVKSQAVTVKIAEM